MPSNAAQLVTEPAPPDDLEPAIARTIAGIHAARASGPYHLLGVTDVAARLAPFLAAQGVRSPRISELKRMGGGASKEQFSFVLERDDGAPRTCVLRMDPMEAGPVITSRAREFEALRALAGRVPVPDALWVDADGSQLGRPALVTGFVGGVAKPSNIQSNVSGFGTVLGVELRQRLAVPFLEHLAAIHALDFRAGALPSFQAPDADAQQAARWALNWWTCVWRNDALAGIPLMGLAERWMRAHLPAARELVLVHSDYRTGNYLFDEARGDITAILDWGAGAHRRLPPGPRLDRHQELESRGKRHLAGLGPHAHERTMRALHRADRSARWGRRARCTSTRCWGPLPIAW
jgi:aminoglycoside phosphotransferase (APT) family kinase protein